MIKTFTEILIEMADAFDSYIAPKKIRRSDTNFIYLILKAVAKGYEILYSVFYALQGKFDPAVCSDRDLDSIARIAGTSRKVGKGSGLVITITNTGLDIVNLEVGEYYYEYSSTVRFLFTVNQLVILDPSDTVQFAAFSDVAGSFLVETVSDLPVFMTVGDDIQPDLVFSCMNNSNLLGYPDESNYSFRRRILDDTERHDVIKEMELEIANLPYIFDCKVVFNQSPDTVIIDGVSVVPYHLLVVLNGDPRDEIAEIVASYGVYPTTLVSSGQVLYYLSDIFVNSQYPVYYALFDVTNYKVQLDYTYNQRLNEDSLIQSAIETVMKQYKDNVRHVSFVTEATFYDEVRALALQSVNLLNVTLLVDDLPVSYLEVPPTRIPKLTAVVYNGTAL